MSLPALITCLHTSFDETHGVGSVEPAASAETNISRDCVSLFIVTALHNRSLATHTVGRMEGATSIPPVTDTNL